MKAKRQVLFLVFRQEDGRWRVVGEHTTEAMAAAHLHDLKRAGYIAGMLRVLAPMVKP
jgi:hypothetical protein